MLSEHGTRENEDRGNYNSGLGMRTDGTHITPAPRAAVSPIRPNPEAQTCLALYRGYGKAKKKLSLPERIVRFHTWWTAL
jgi:hypothetical protein